MSLKCTLGSRCRAALGPSAPRRSASPRLLGILWTTRLKRRFPRRSNEPTHAPLHPPPPQHDRQAGRFFSPGRGRLEFRAILNRFHIRYSGSGSCLARSGYPQLAVAISQVYCPPVPSRGLRSSLLPSCPLPRITFQFIALPSPPADYVPVSGDSKCRTCRSLFSSLSSSVLPAVCECAAGGTCPSYFSSLSFFLSSRGRRFRWILRQTALLRPPVAGYTD